MASDDQSSHEGVDRAAYDAAFPVVSDALTLHLWREPAFHLSRAATQAGIESGAARLAAALLALLAFWLFWNGQYWWGLLSAFAFSFLDLAGTMIARSAAEPSKSSDALANVLDLLVPPLWWWAWEHGLAPFGRPIAPVYATMLLWAIVGGYVADRLIEARFIRKFGRMPIHRWRKLDSRFRLGAAGRNVNLVILGASMLLRRPDAGLVVAAWWTIASLLFHAVRYAQASEQAALGRPVASWLDE